MAAMSGTAGAPGAPCGPEPGGEFLFDAVLYPQRSLGPTGFLVLMLAVGLVSLVTGIAFLLAGAWPVFGFFGLDVLLLYLAFRASYRSGRMYEHLRLTRERLTVLRHLPSGQVRRWQFDPYWLRVDLGPPAEPASMSQT